LRQNATLLDEMVLDVNTRYFDERGGYEFAKKYFEEAYRFAVEVAGGEQYILSAVMHADERNKAASEEAGRDVYHYHLHVVFVPVVQKEVRYSKRYKEIDLRGTIKEIVPQISHSNKFPGRQKTDGKVAQINAYSVLQDQYFQHMRNAGFEGFERGEKGSTREHLSDVEYKTQQETKRAEQASAQAAIMEEMAVAKTDEIAELEKSKCKQQRELENAKKQTKFTKQVVSSTDEIASLVKPTFLGNKVELTLENWKRVFHLVKEALSSRGVIADLRSAKTALEKKLRDRDRKISALKGGGLTEELQFYQAKQRAPQRLAEVLAEIRRNPPESQDSVFQSAQKRYGQER
jgi:hypothetical protein